MGLPQDQHAQCLRTVYPVSAASYEVQWREENAMAGHEYEPGDVAARGEAIYREQVQRWLEAKRDGRPLTLDALLRHDRNQQTHSQ